MREAPPDVLLLDIMMPGMNGFEVCRRMKADPELAHIPVIMITALDAPADRVRGLEAGADDFLTKPIDNVALFARLRSILRLKLLLDELRLRDDTLHELGLPDDGASSVDGGTGARVLAVEDDPGAVEAIEAALSGENAVTCVGDEDAALREAEAGAFDLIIVSLGLEDCDGLRLCSHLRSRDATRHVPLLVLADAGDSRRMAKGLDLGANDYLYKPIEHNELLARARSQIRQKRYQDRLRRTYHDSISMAVTDSLTALYNRRYLTSHLEALLGRLAPQGKPLALAMVDIDHFKAVNDRHGHAVGDEVLREVAQTFRRCFRASDLIARLGGEEFVIVMPATELADAETIAVRLRCEIADARLGAALVEGGLPVTVSVGIAAMEGPADTSDALLKRADDALYQAKEGGRNRVIAALG